MAKAKEACELLRELPEMNLAHVLEEIGGILPGHRFASVKSEAFSLKHITFVNCILMKRMFVLMGCEGKSWCGDGYD